VKGRPGSNSPFPRTAATLLRSASSLVRLFISATKRPGTIMARAEPARRRVQFAPEITAAVALRARNPGAAEVGLAHQVEIAQVFDGTLGDDPSSLHDIASMYLSSIEVGASAGRRGSRLIFAASSASLDF
jgi:hypothetical protein